MRFSLQFLTIMLLAFLLELMLPWWSIAIAGFIGGAVLTSRANFLAGFLAIAMFWTLYALIIQSSAAAPLAERVAQILMVKKTPLLFLATAVIGGLVGGFAALTGSAIHKKKKKSYYY